MPDLMIDIETGDTAATAAIFSVAACVFDPLSTEAPLETLHFAVDPAESDKHHRTISGSTMAWWTQQPAALQALSKLPQRSLRQVVDHIDVMCLQHRVENIWANSPSFDLAILRHLYAQLERRFPRPFYAERDVRTMKALLPKDELPPFIGQQHNALDDCVYQAQIVQAAMTRLCLLPA